MADREKVIERLEECLSASCRGFRICPYGDAEWDAVRAALELLREQEPVTPKTDGTSIYDVDGLIVCGKCGGSLGMPEVFKFCPWCGKAVDWDA